MLANERRRAISGGVGFVPKETCLFLATVSSVHGLPSQATFLNRLRDDEGVKREACPVVREEVVTSMSDSGRSKDTAYDVKQLARTCEDESRRNPQPLFDDLVRSYSLGELMAVQCVQCMVRIDAQFLVTR